MRGNWFIVIALACALSGCGRQEQTYRAAEPSAPPAAAKRTSVPRYHALVVGISDYGKGNGWDTLHSARRDADAVAGVLEAQYGFQVTRLFDRDATRETVMAALDDLASLTQDDAILIYFAGHGFYDEALGEGYWIPSDAAKERNGKFARADWIWNSTITKMISASPARHVLVVADACFGGSLFRGEAARAAAEDLHWYARAIQKPSRFLITSGDLEPVLDSGGAHSVFAQELLNILSHPDKPVFSASDVGVALREKVSTLTGQLVRMGPLPVATHAGGEFVFVAKDADVAGWDAAPEPVQLAATRSAPEKNEGLRDAALMESQGAAKSADAIVKSLLGRYAEDQVVRALADQLDSQKRQARNQELQTLIERLESRTNRVEGHDANFVRPRVLACLGPVSQTGGAEMESIAALVRIGLESELDRAPGLRVVERAALEDILRELNIASSGAADERLRTETGRLLPASLLLLGDVIPGTEGATIHLRLVDTETSRILASTSNAFAQDAQPAEFCARLASEILEAIRREKPLTAGITPRGDGTATAAIGSFQGVSEGAEFALVERDPPRTAGVARIVNVLGETESSLELRMAGGFQASPTGTLWIVEAQ